MGWLNRGSQRHLNMLRLCIRKIRIRKNKLQKQVFKYEYNNGNKHWCYEMREIFKALGYYLYQNFMSCNINLARLQFQKFENKKWKAGLETKSKLRINIKLKEEKKIDLFVQMNMNRKKRSYLSQLRYGICQLK